MPEPRPVPSGADLSADRDWWRQATVYQIYPRSFADDDGDGIGDLRGITSRIPYLSSLGVDAVWLSPFYPSALVDGGYDVDDYRDVDPRLGTLADFDAMAAALHAAGIRVMVDIVPNHTSDRHAWFRAALAGAPGSAERQRYIFRDGTGPGGDEPPSDWQSMFGGPAWERVPDGQWYLHLFAREQPDLDWDNREVRDDFLTTLRFWSDRGVDGFRVDVAHGLTKDMSEPLAPWADVQQKHGVAGSHPLWDRDELEDVYAEWRRVFDEYDPPRMAVAEAWVHPDRLPRYASATGLGQAFSFDLLRARWDAVELRSVIRATLANAAAAGSTSTWVLSNHDVVRHATRYGLPQDPETPTDGAAWLRTGGTTPPLDRELGLRRARAGALLELALPGACYLYQGEELGLHEVAEIADTERQDPAFHRTGGEAVGRDGCRVPLPWDAGGPSYGFGSERGHLPQPEWFGPVSVRSQDGVAGSTLELYRDALRLRRELAGPETLEWVDDESVSVLHFERPGGWHCVVNLGPDPVALPAGDVLVTSDDLDAGRLPPDTAAWVRT